MRLGEQDDKLTATHLGSKKSFLRIVACVTYEVRSLERSDIVEEFTAQTFAALNKHSKAQWKEEEEGEKKSLWHKH